MAYNPPDTRDEIRDTLGCIGIPYRYEKVQGPKGHAYNFELQDGLGDICIYSPSYITWIGKNKKRERFGSVYETKLGIIQQYRHLI